MDTMLIDRRAFLGRISVTVAGVAVAALVPASLLQASPACVYADPCGDWQLDDMCAAYPPYSMHFEPGVARHAAMTASIPPADLNFIA